MVRVLMLQTKIVPDGGGTIAYEAGMTCNVLEELMAEWLAEDPPVACPDGVDPPVRPTENARDRRGLPAPVEPVTTPAPTPPEDETEPEPAVQPDLPLVETGGRTINPDYTVSHEED